MPLRPFAFVRFLTRTLPIVALCAGTLACSASSATTPKPVSDVALSSTPGKQTAVLAGGCFWGVEAVFEHLQGVEDVVSGYAGGDASTANYDAIGTGRTGHAESVRITYDPSKITYGQLLQVFFQVAHDPTQLNRQGPDQGSQYRSAIFVADDAQKRVAQSYIDQLDQARVFPKPIVTQLAPLQTFYPAESYHQDFIKLNPAHPYVVIHDLPKLAQLRKQFSSLYQDPS
ncbi:MAG: peptide-methionine (S)-S-oxide reductase MsrA [Aphanocapsa lilacina HA4352-LM1]|jgi:peptide-methionine (S)-S-oxide reductase|nr:peptide-methionine (S)-S-oxide reductase MsrA [Aphanocapsa lilacina HA4352-LM1]